MENLKWRQRAKVNWYKLGDHNRRFFHAAQRMKRKKIDCIRNDETVCHTSMEGIQ